ncbi:MAG: ATP synthase F1 subunit epsilon [Firmicutes bacterium]|nr:ATP synthase F1 subunit epsilon [Bacillota bacterium]MBQ9605205.1 ATP synthase F1 subunit epsilon [Bacillota bacterium]
MAENKIALKVITPSREMYNGEADMVIMRTKSGDVGILHGHQPMVTVLDYGVMRIQNEGEEDKNAAVFGGFAEINAESITVLTDAAEWSDEIDLSRAEEARKRAEERLKSRSADIDVARAELALKRSLIRIGLKN